MSSQESIVVKQWRQDLMDIQGVLMLDGRTKEAKKKTVQRKLLISIASDEELEEIARINADLLSTPVNVELEELKEIREDHRKTVKSWWPYPGKSKAV